MKPVFFVALFFLFLCVAGSGVAETINLDSQELAKFPWEPRPESNTWIKDAPLESARMTFWIEKTTIQDTVQDTSVPALQFTLVLSCGKKSSPFTMTWMSGNQLPSVDFHCTSGNVIQIQPILEQNLYPLPQEALNYLVNHSGN